MSMFFKILLLSVIIQVIIAEKAVNVEINFNNYASLSTDYFVSYTLDIANWFQPTPFNTTLRSATFQYMAKQLNPAVLRVGGSEADYTYYFTNDKTGQCSNVPNNYHCFTKQNLESLINFTSSVGCKVLFGLSIGYPYYPNKTTQSWDSSNAEYFLNYIVNNNYGQYFYGFELGNEVNKDVEPSFQINAFKELRELLQNTFGKSNNLKMPILAGPDPHSGLLRADNTSWEWIEEFIRDACDGVVDAFTYHCYINVNQSYLLTQNGINEQYKESNRFQQAVQQNCPNYIQSVYAGEIAEHNGGGTDGFTNKYEDSLWYLNALGVISLMGQKGFFRQQLWGDEYHPNYALLNNIGDTNNEMYVPLPDYWIAVLFKQLMGTNVFNATSNYDYFRVFSRCYIGNPSVVMAYINFDNQVLNVSYGKNLGTNHMDYIITSDKNQLDTTQIYLNGKSLILNSDHTIPVLNYSASTSNPFQIPPYSVGFIHFSDVRNQLCRH